VPDWQAASLPNAEADALPDAPAWPQTRRLHLVSLREAI
jgi:hypothetical protein